METSGLPCISKDTNAVANAGSLSRLTYCVVLVVGGCLELYLGIQNCTRELEKERVGRIQLQESL